MNIELLDSLFFVILTIIAAYLLGSIPSAVWYGQAFFGIDVRDYGSGNAGATNTFRVLGKRAGSIVMAIDILKGWTASSLPWFLVIWDIIPADDLILYQLLHGVAAVLGHVFPIYANFKGGKGVATLFGMVLAIQLNVALLCVGIFILVLILSKYVSLGSMIGTLAFPVLLMLPRFNPEEPALIIFGFAMFAIVMLTHQKNLRRILKGEESKANIRLRKRE
ncbi:glycerol-3-phosphate 1-O-acyltransferase PlsY [Hyphobacterium sp. CCMP332]|nr:glycerol-3-phosphate 1-O-acyltransferase PlsY [Hyphobacterium sp. CCMP332]